MLVEANAALVEAAGRCAAAEKGAAEVEVERARLSKQVALAYVVFNYDIHGHVKCNVFNSCSKCCWILRRCVGCSLLCCVHEWQRHLNANNNLQSVCVLILLHSNSLPPPLRNAQEAAAHRVEVASLKVFE